MLPIRPASRFKKDLKRAAKQSRNIKKLQQVLEQLAIPAPLPSKHKDHKLKGNWIDFRECHIEPDYSIFHMTSCHFKTLFALLSGIYRRFLVSSHMKRAIATVLYNLRF